MSNSISNRRQAREAAMQALYQIDSNNEWEGSLSDKSNLKLFFDNFYIADNGADDSANREFAYFLAEGVIRERQVLDDLISKASDNWPISRMNRTDLNILRLSAFECLNCKETPSSVCISEALEIAKKFSNPESLDFINAVLDKILKQGSLK